MTQHHPFRSEESRKQCLAAFHALEKSSWPIESEPRNIETSNGKTFMRVSGSENAPPLVLLHGIGGNSLNWSNNIEKLSEYFRTYAVDTIDDYGLSTCTKPIKDRYDYAKWLDELFTGLGLENNINLMGHSYGGWLASQYALHFQNRLNKTIFLAPASTILPIRLQFYVRQILMLLPFRIFKESFFKWVDPTTKNHSDTKEEIDLLEVSMRCYKPKHSIVRPTVLKDDELKSLKSDTFFLIGENEKIYSPGKAIGRIERIAPHIKKEIVPKAGHISILQPHLINEKILKFLEE